MELKVYLLDKCVGSLSTTADRGIVFKYDDEYVNQNGSPLSLSLPLQKEEFSIDRRIKKQANAFRHKRTTAFASWSARKNIFGVF